MTMAIGYDDDDGFDYGDDYDFWRLRSIKLLYADKPAVVASNAPIPRCPLSPHRSPLTYHPLILSSHQHLLAVDDVDASGWVDYTASHEVVVYRSLVCIVLRNDVCY